VHHGTCDAVVRRLRTRGGRPLAIPVPTRLASTVEASTDPAPPIRDPHHHPWDRQDARIAPRQDAKLTPAADVCDNAEDMKDRNIPTATLLLT
jgi:hypothetical protein